MPAPPTLTLALPLAALNGFRVTQFRTSFLSATGLRVSFFAPGILLVACRPLGYAPVARILEASNRSWPNSLRQLPARLQVSRPPKREFSYFTGCRVFTPAAWPRWIFDRPKPSVAGPTTGLKPPSIILSTTCVRPWKFSLALLPARVEKSHQCL